jgi:hypothetical protein
VRSGDGNERPRASRALRASATAGLLFGVSFVGIVGFAHTEPGRPLLAVMGHLLGKSSVAREGRCPLGYDVKADPVAKEAARRQFAATHAGRERVRARPALGFQLDETTRADVMRWAARESVKCVVPKTGSDLDCSDVPADALPGRGSGPAFHSLWFTFGARDCLISAVGVRRDPRVEEVSTTFERVTLRISLAAGPPTTVQGDPTPPALSSGALYQASAEYRFVDYFAVARATNLGPAQGFVLTEEYRSLPES